MITVNPQNLNDNAILTQQNVVEINNALSSFITLPNGKTWDQVISVTYFVNSGTGSIQITTTP